jgi:hypothetical protein
MACDQENSNPNSSPGHHLLLSLPLHPGLNSSHSPSLLTDSASHLQVAGVLPYQDFLTADPADIETLIANLPASTDGGSTACNLLAASPHIPPAMLRRTWSLEDFTLLKHLHHGCVVL